MADLIGLAVILAFVAAAVIGLRVLSRVRVSTEEEFEKRASESVSFGSAGFQAMNGILNPSAEKGNLVVAEVKQGRYLAKKKEGKGLGHENEGEK